MTLGEHRKKFSDRSVQEQFDIHFEDEMKNFITMEKLGSNYSRSHLNNIRQLVKLAQQKNIIVPEKVLNFLILQ